MGREQRGRKRLTLAQVTEALNPAPPSARSLRDASGPGPQAVEPLAVTEFGGPEVLRVINAHGRKQVSAHFAPGRPVGPSCSSDVSASQRVVAAHYS
jgi:hypothetical protein